MVSFILIIIAISLFIDAFSLSLVPASSKLKNNEILLLSIIIGLFNLLIIWIGFFFGEIILKFIPLSPQLLVSLILLYVGSQMILESNKKRLLNRSEPFLKLIVIAFVFSVDNISLGLSLNYLNYNYYLFSLVIASLSILFSFTILSISKLITKSFFDNSKFICGIILIIISLIYLIV